MSMAVNKSAKAFNNHLTLLIGNPFNAIMHIPMTGNRK